MSDGVRCPACEMAFYRKLCTCGVCWDCCRCGEARARIEAMCDPVVPDLSAPADSDTGIAWPGADRISLIAGGLEHLQFRADGQVLIQSEEVGEPLHPAVFRSRSRRASGPGSGSMTRRLEGGRRRGDRAR